MVLTGRSRIRLLLYVTLATALLLPSAASAQEAGTLTVVPGNGTAGATVPPDLEVELLGFRGEVLAGTWRDLERDDQGRPFADGLSTDPSWVYVATATYKGLTFASDPASYSGESGLQVPLAVFEPATEDPGVLLTDYSLVLAREADGARLRAVHTVTLQLPGDRALPADPTNRLLRFALPPDTTAVSALAGPASWEVGPEGRELFGSATLRPGESTFSFEYQFLWDRTGQELLIGMPAPTIRFRVWGVESQVRISAPRLDEQPGLQMNERARLAIYEGRDLAAGEAVALRLRDPGYGLVERFNVALEGRWSALAAVLAGFALVLAAFLARLLQRRRRLHAARILLARAQSPGGDDEAAGELGELLAEDPGLARRLRTTADR